MIEQELIDFAVAAAQRAGRITLDWYQLRGLSVTAKSDGSPVTEADYAAERFLRSEILATYPGRHRSSGRRRVRWPAAPGAPG